MTIRGVLMLVGALLCHGATAAEPFRVPLVEGLVEVIAVKQDSGDEEWIVTVTSATPEFVTLGVEYRELEDGTMVSHEFTRRMRRADLAASNRLNQVVQTGDPELFPGATMSILSAQSLTDLKTKGRVAMVVGSLSDRDLATQKDLPPLLRVMAGRKYFRGDMVRVGTGTEPLTVQVNGQARVLQTVHARGDYKVGDDRFTSEVWILDDPQFALILKSGRGEIGSQTVRIDYPQVQPRASVLEEALTEACRAELSGIYFDFGQATLLPASQPALAAVAKLMQDNPGWTLRIEGHTDNVGGAAYNLDLSKRRAQAVRDALVTQSQLAAARLQSSGLGASKPVAGNDTLEGRAANRRVELVRDCP